MPVYLIRHTAPNVPPGLCYGQLDVPLKPTFEADAAQVNADLPAVDIIYTSPLSRCQKLADVLAEARKLPVKQDSRLMEMDFGHWEETPWDVIAREEIDAWAAEFWTARPHGGESVADLKARTDAALADIAQTYQRSAIVTHAGVIKAALATAPTAEGYDRKIAFGAVIPVL